MKPQRLLMREFIHRQLYGLPGGGYFGKPGLVLSPKPFDFAAMTGEPCWRKAVAEAYACSRQASAPSGYVMSALSVGQESWSTPVELFKPHYSTAVANYIEASSGTLCCTKGSAVLTVIIDAGKHPLRIVELGGGNGTCAKVSP